MSAPPITEGYAYPDLLPRITHALRCGLSVFVRSSPGLGKSTMAHEIAETKLKLPMIDIRLAQKDPAEVGGVYIPNHETKTLQLYAPDWVQLACKAAHFVFLDEINAAVSKLHQAGAYQIVLEHRVGPFQFHPETVVMAAGNLEEDEALAVPMSSALQNRFVHFVLRCDADAWIRWGAGQGLSPDIIAYIGFAREKALYNRTGEYAYATPRSWTMAARLDSMDLKDTERRQLIASCVGQAASQEFMTFTKVYRQVDVPAILQRGEIPSIDPRKDPGFVYALTFAVGHLLRSRGLPTGQVPNLYKLFEHPGFGPEFQMLLIKNIEGTKAFTVILDNSVFNPIKSRLVKLATSTLSELN